LESCTSKTA